MRKIMFNDKYGLTRAVLDGRKTMTRRIVPLSLYNQTDWKSVEEGNYVAVVDGEGYYHDIRRCGNYQIGDVVAVAQAYKDVYPNADFEMVGNEFMTESAGWNNKMFVRAALMLNRIRITNIKVERLQDISEEDCIKEGVQCLDTPDGKKYVAGGFNVPARDRKLLIEGKAKLAGDSSFDSGREAFAYLIDHISGKGTWARNPWVFAYEFKLLKP